MRGNNLILDQLILDGQLSQEDLKDGEELAT